MHAAVVYESMYGNTRAVAEAIGAGLAPYATVLPVEQATPDQLAIADLLVVGAPTHMHGLSRPATRRLAVKAARRPDNAIPLEPEAMGPGVREWLASIGGLCCRAAAFDTRLDGLGLLTGRASRTIARLLRRRGAQVVAHSQSFLLDKQSQLLDGELDRARAWGESLAQKAAHAGR
jgi:flavodoxin-like protein